MLSIAILYNSKAGKGKGSGVYNKIKSLLDKRELKYTLYIDDWPTDYQSFSSVWIIGGDGTLNYFINHAQGNLPPLAIFKAGTGNDFANCLYGEAGTEEMVDIVLSASPKSVDAGVCNGSMFLNMAGIGFDGEVLKKMNMIRWLGAFLGYYLAILISIVSYREPYYTISTEGGSCQQQKLLLLLINNAPTTGGGFRVSPLSDPMDGKLELITCAALGIWKRLFALPLVRKGKHLDLPYVHSLQVTRVHIAASYHLFAQIDGDLIEASEFDVHIRPGYFRFLY